MSEIIHYYIEQVQKGDDKAFNFIASHYEPLVRKTVNKILKGFPELKKDKAEIISLAWDGVWHGIRTYDLENPRHVPYCVTKSMNRTIAREIYQWSIYNDHIDKSVKENGITKDLPDELEDMHDEGPAEQLLRKEDYNELHRAVQQLPEFYRRIIVLHYRIGYSIQEVAEEYRLSTSHIAHSLKVARNLLRRFLLDKAA